MVLEEIADTLKFLKREGCQIYLGLSEDFSREIREELAEFALTAEFESETENISIFYDNRKIAEISMVKNKEKLHAVSIPLKYMLYKLYEETRDGVSAENKHDIYSKAVQYINEHLAEDISVADIAKHINYSESYFGYAFKKKYKISVLQYIRELKLAKSKDLLKNTSFSIAGVACCVGFADPNYFSSLFKKYFGVSPKDYRKAHSRRGL